MAVRNLWLNNISRPFGNIGGLFGGEVEAEEIPWRAYYFDPKNGGSGSIFLLYEKGGDVKINFPPSMGGAFGMSVAMGADPEKIIRAILENSILLGEL